jgi:hypothetical protein
MTAQSRCRDNLNQSSVPPDSAFWKSFAATLAVLQLCCSGGRTTLWHHRQQKYTKKIAARGIYAIPFDMLDYVAETIDDTSTGKAPNGY